MHEIIWLLVGVAVVVGLSFSRFCALWFQSLVSGTPIALFNIIGMSMRKIPARLIVNAHITLYKAGIKTVSVADLETHYLARGNVLAVVHAMIAADKANIALSWRQATAIDLAGRDILDAVKTSVNPKVIDCGGKGEHITAVAQNGIQLMCHARVTVRTNLEQLVGGATEETIVARVGEGIINAIGSAKTHIEVLESPQKISKLILDKGLDAQTAFEILSIDIAYISVGENIGARLKADQAEADERVARAKAEERRALAVAIEQENKAVVVERRAEVIAAEAQIPKAIAHAFEQGSLGVMDYYRLKNVEADTKMRASFALEGVDHEEE